MYRIALAGFALCGVMAAAVAQAETIKPVKESKHEIAGQIFQRPNAVKKTEGGNATTDVTAFTSRDSAFETGMYKSGPAHEEIKGPDGFPYNEFLYFISGGARLTSSDGSVMVVNAGEAVTIPKGWTGHFDTDGYTKMYATYNPDEAKR